MSKKVSNAAPGSNFINFLRSFSPVSDGTSQHFEDMRKNIRANDIKPFKFKLKRQLEYKETIKELVSKRESRVLLLTGSAGDGKTSFLHDICVDKDIFGINEAAWDDATTRHAQQCITIEDPASYQAIDHSDDKEDARKYIAHEIYLAHEGIKICVIRDLSEISSVQDKLLMYKTLSQIVERVLYSKKNSEDNDCSSGASNKLGANARATKAKGIVDSEQNIEALYLIIACNNGKLLDRLNEYESFVNSMHDEFSHHTNEVIESIKNLSRSLESHMILHTKLHNEFCDFFSLAECLDRDTVESIFSEILNHDLWDLCKECSAVESCPIYNNRRVLNNEHVMRRFADLFEISNDEGAHITLRNLLLLISNAILGRKTKGKNPCYDCRAVLALKDRSDSAMSPFDNLFGLNLLSGDNLKSSYDSNINRRSSQNSKIPIFMHMATFGVGNSSNKAIDNLITYGDSITAASGYGSKSDFASTCLECINQNDVAHVYDSLKKELQYLFDAADDDYAKNRAKKNAHLPALYASLRRTLFFTLDLDKSAHNKAEESFSNYYLTAFKYADSYLSLKRGLNEGSSLSRNNHLTSILEQLFIGLNRACTSLPAIKAMDKVFIASNNRINPVELCIIPDEEHFRLHINLDSSNYFNVIKVVSSSMVNNTKNLPTIAYFASKDDAKACHEKELAPQVSSESLKNYLGVREYSDFKDLIYKHTKFQDKLGQQNYEALLSEDRVGSLFEKFYEFLEGKNEYGLLEGDEERFYKLLSKIFSQQKPSSSSLSSEGVEPYIVSSMVLTPSLFEFLMSLGDGVSSVSFSNEFSETILSFKAKIEEFQYRSMQVSGNRSISSLKFCRLNADAPLVTFLIYWYKYT